MRSTLISRPAIGTVSLSWIQTGIINQARIRPPSCSYEIDALYVPLRPSRVSSHLCRMGGWGRAQPAPKNAVRHRGMSRRRDKVTSSTELAECAMLCITRCVIKIITCKLIACQDDATRQRCTGPVAAAARGPRLEPRASAAQFAYNRTDVNIWGNPVSPSPCLWGRQALPTGRVWEGEALPRTRIFSFWRCAPCA